MSSKQAPAIQGTKHSYSIDEIVEEGPFGRTTIHREIKNGRLKAHKCGRRTIVLRGDYKAWLSALPEMNSEATQPMQSSAWLRPAPRVSEDTGLRRELAVAEAHEQSGA